MRDQKKTVRERKTDDLDLLLKLSVAGVGVLVDGHQLSVLEGYAVLNVALGMGPHAE
jgi:hypothetical protein